MEGMKKGAAIRQDHRAGSSTDWSQYRIPQRHVSWLEAFVVGCIIGVPWMLVCILEAVIR